MIQINRSNPPRALSSPRSRKAKYRNKAVVKKLWDMQHEKCCYCEQKIPQDGHLKAVEHFRPKGIFRGLKNEWPNLLLACAQCNGKKSDKFPTELTNQSEEPKVVYQKLNRRGRPLIIDPSDPNIDPEEYLDFEVKFEQGEEFGLIMARNNNTLGRVTIAAIALDDEFHTKNHRSFIRTLVSLLLIVGDAEDNKNPETIQDCLTKFRLYMSSNYRFAGVARAFARNYRLDRRLGISIPRGCNS